MSASICNIADFGFCTDCQGTGKWYAKPWSKRKTKCGCPCHKQAPKPTDDTKGPKETP